MNSNKVIYSDSNGNCLRVSSVFEADQPIQFKEFSAKYVISGKENYKINHKKFVVKEGEYVVGNQQTESKVFIDHAKQVEGICIDVSKKLISEIIDFKYNTKNSFSDFLFRQECMVQKYNSKNTSLGYSMRSIASELQNLQNLQNQNIKINTELFMSIAECIVHDQSLVFKSFNKLKFKKNETNSRLFDCAHEAKNYMQTHFLETISLEEISKEAKVSEYHFIRVFKTIFGITPYKYLIRLRLHHALYMLKNNYSISETAYLIGYFDVAAFSKAFKRFHGFSPSKVSN